jgi:hypothetical protein
MGERLRLERPSTPTSNATQDARQPNTAIFDLMRNEQTEWKIFKPID